MSEGIANPWWRRRPGLAGALLFGAVAILLAATRAIHEPGWPTDLDPQHFAVRALLRGANPYESVGPGREFNWEWPLYYPLPGLLLLAPIAWLPVVLARVAFAAASGALLGYALCRRGFSRLPVLMSAAFMIAIFRSQWSPLITAAFFLPWAGVFVAAKPNMGLPFLAGAPTRRHFLAIAGLGAGVGLASLIVSPGWPLDWLRTLGSKQYIVAPVMNPGGFLLLLALVKWRRPEARVLAVLACMPQTPSVYDLLPLVIVPRTTREVTVFSLLTTALFMIVVAAGPFPSFNRYAYFLERTAIWVVYLPVLAMVLRRPNVWRDPETAAAPATRVRAWVDRLPRLDAVLLLLAAASAALLFWVTLATERL